MQIKKIRLVNFRGMEDLTVEFDAGVNIIIGDNGAGKTSLLKGLKIVLSNMFQDNEHIAQSLIFNEDIRFIVNNVGDATKALRYYTPSTIEGDIEFDSKMFRSKAVRKNENSDSAMDNVLSIYDNDYDNSLQELISNLLNNKNSKLPLLNYQSDQRKLLTSAKMEKGPTELIERRQGYEGAMSGDFDINVIQNWCLQMELRNFQEGEKINEYETFKRGVAQFVRAIEGTTINGNVYFASDLWTLVYHDGKNRQPLYSLSSGYQSILCMIMELAYRAVLLNPTLDDFSNLEGVVLIDEIDVHLHPKWQWRIIGALRATFPKVQFIVATHSPIVLSSAEDAKLIFMTSPNEVEPLDNVYGINVNDVLELRQQSTDLPPELKEFRKRISRCLNNNDIQGAEVVIKEAATQYNEDSALVKKLQEFFQMNKWIAEE